MKRDGLGGTRTLLALAALLAVTGTGLGQEIDGAPVATTPRFTFHNDRDTNLNDALIAAGVARNFTRPGPFDAGDASSCFEALPPSVRAGWTLAVDYYAEVVSPTDWTDRTQQVIRMDLAGLHEELGDGGARRYAEITRGVRAAAAPAYTACLWPTRQATNRRWIDEVSALLAAHGEAIAARLARHYRKAWPDGPMRVDVVETVSWSGANSTFPDSSPGHLLISTSSRGSEALEVVFHEASHGFMLPGDPLPTALEEAAAEVGVAEPDDLWHVILFYTTGETVRRVLHEAGRTDHRRLLDDIFERGVWVEYREAVESVWPSYLSGERDLRRAMLDVVRATVRPGPWLYLDGPGGVS